MSVAIRQSTQRHVREYAYRKTPLLRPEIWHKHVVIWCYFIHFWSISDLKSSSVFHDLLSQPSDVFMNIISSLYDPSRLLYFTVTRISEYSITNSFLRNVLNCPSCLSFKIKIPCKKIFKALTWLFFPPSKTQSYATTYTKPWICFEGDFADESINKTRGGVLGVRQ